MADTLLTHPCNPCETTWLKNSMPSYIPRKEAEQNDVERFDAELCSCSDSENRDGKGSFLCLCISRKYREDISKRFRLLRW